MARNFEARTIYAYSIHGRTPSGVLDYPRFFEALAEIAPVNRQTSVRDEMVAITWIGRVGGRWLIRFVSGREGLPPLFYDPETGAESFGELGGQVVVSVNWMMIDPVARFAAIERRRPGVPVDTMAKALGHMAGELGLVDDRLVIDLNPVAAESFLEEMERFERIRQAAVTLARPNFNWTDNASELSGYAAESNASTVEVLMSAPRSESLDKTSGIVADIRQLVRDRISAIKNLRVTGTRSGEPKETSMSLKRHQEKRAFPVPLRADSSAEQEFFQSAADSFLDDLDQDSEPTATDEPI